MVQKVIVQGWSIKDKKEIIGQSAAGEVTKIGGGKIGAEQASVFGESVAYITDVPVSSQEVANKIAKAEMERTNFSGSTRGRWRGPPVTLKKPY